MSAHKKYQTAPCVANFMTVDGRHLAMFSTDAQAAECLVKLNAHDDLVAELLAAEKIIVAMLNVMTLKQKTAADEKLTSAGISPCGMTRHHERLTALEKAGVA